MGFNLDTPPPSVCEKVLHIFVEVFDKSFKPYCNSGKMNLRDEFMLITHGKMAYSSIYWSVISRKWFSCSNKIKIQILFLSRASNYSGHH